jgi:hypothetical protein
MKMLVPFMEKASTEDMDSEMHDRWAALLLSASSQFHARHLTFLDILGRLSSDELKFLENVCFSFKDFPETSYPSGHIEQNRASVEAAMEHLFVPNGIGSQHAYLKFVNETKLTYGEIMHASVVVAEGGHAFHYSDFGAPGLPGFGSLEILQRERLIEIERLKSQKIDVEAAYFNLTFLGITFVRDCSPEGSRMWQERLGRAGVG